MVLLKSNDGFSLEVRDEVASQSNLVKTVLEERNAEDGVPLANINGVLLAKIIDYCTKQVDLQAEVAASKEEIRVWENQFMDVSMDMLYHLYLAAHYMDIKGLLDLCAEKTAEKIRGKSVKEIRKVFNITNDFTPEEEEKLQAPYKWAFN